MNNCKEERELIYPAIYKHWKGKDYATMYIAKPLDKEEFWNIKYSKCLTTIHTETKEKVFVKVFDKNVYYLDSHNTKDELVLYKALYDDIGVYAREKTMFLSEVPEGREAENITNQKYRFELVKY